MDKKVKVIIGILVISVVLLVAVLGIVVFGMKGAETSATGNQNLVLSEGNAQNTDVVEQADSGEGAAVSENGVQAATEQSANLDTSGWKDVSDTTDAIVEADTVKLLPILDAFSIDGKHVTEWDVDSLIATHGLYMTNGKYQNEKESENEYEEAKVSGNDKTFIWNKVSKKTGVKYSFELQESYKDLSDYTYFTFVTLTSNPNGDNPWAKNGFTEFAIDNNITDAKSFLTYLGVSDTVADTIIADGKSHLFATDCPGENRIPAVIYCDWNGVRVRADELILIYHQDIGRLELIYSDRTFEEWR